MDKDRVLLLHGLGRSRLSMARAARRLTKAGFETLNVGYPSRRMAVGELAGWVDGRLRAAGFAERPFHALTHSMGGIVVRALAQLDPPLPIARVVMLGPPNRGSHVASRLRDRWYFRAILGPAGQEIGDGPDSVPNILGPPPFEVGVVAGTRRADPLALVVTSPGDNDGRVTVDETRVDGMTDFLVVHRSHGFMMNDPAVIDAAVRFFRTGRFADAAAAHAKAADATSKT